jgi:hypothetical protein
MPKRALRVRLCGNVFRDNENQRGHVREGTRTSRLTEVSNRRQQVLLTA